MRFFRILPLKNKVVFQSFDGNSYSDNPRLIFEQMLAVKPNLDYVWILKDGTRTINGAKVAKKGTIAAIYHLATAKLWIDNSRKNAWVRKRRGQYYVQTWHGDICIKKIEKDAIDILGKEYEVSARHDSQMADLMISGSTFRTNNYRQSFWYNGEILELGTPISDIFYKNPSAIKNRVAAVFKLQDNTQIALYAPTFRDGDDVTCYNMDYEKLLYVLKQRWPGKWIVIVRLHPRIQALQGIVQYTDNVINGSCYDNFNELLVASDLLITDYSSGMFQAAEAKKRVVLYASDYRDFLNGRGGYFDIKELPFPFTETNAELQKAILEFDEENYFWQISELKRQLGYFNSAESTILVVQNILNRVRWE